MKYDLWMTQGQGGGIVASFDNFDAANKAMKEGLERKDGSYFIDCPEEDDIGDCK